MSQTSQATGRLYAGHVIVRCRDPRGEFELAMAPEGVTGFLAWLEAAPPGRGPRIR